MCTIQKWEAMLSQSDKAALLVREQEWNEERQRYQAAIKEHQDIIQKADMHMEEEIKKLHAEISLQCQQQVDDHIKDIEEQYEEKLKSSAEEVEKLVIKIEGMHADIQKLQTKYAKDVKNLGTKLEAAEANLQKLKALMEVNQRERQNLEAKLLEAGEKAERQSQEASESLCKVEKEHAKVVEQYKTRLQEVTGTLQRTEQHLKSVESRAKKQLQVITESLEREHTAAVENMRAKFVEQHNEDVARREAELEAFEKAKSRLEDRILAIKKELREVKLELKNKEEELQQEKRQMTNTPCQVSSNYAMILWSLTWSDLCLYSHIHACIVCSRLRRWTYQLWIN